MSQPFTLPPLNPMSTAPRNQAVILVLKDGRICRGERSHLVPDQWHAYARGGGASEAVRDNDCFGWWPFPEVREPTE